MKTWQHLELLKCNHAIQCHILGDEFNHNFLVNTSKYLIIPIYYKISFFYSISVLYSEYIGLKGLVVFVFSRCFCWFMTLLSLAICFNHYSLYYIDSFLLLRLLLYGFFTIIFFTFYDEFSFTSNLCFELVFLLIYWYRHDMIRY